MGSYWPGNTAAALFTQFLNELFSSTYLGSLSEYGVFNATLIGTMIWNPPGGFHAQMHDGDFGQVLSTLLNGFQGGAVPAGATILSGSPAGPPVTGANVVYIFFPPFGTTTFTTDYSTWPNNELQQGVDFSAYHTTLPASVVGPYEMYFVSIPWPLTTGASPASASYVNQRTIDLSHELVEILTDPSTQNYGNNNGGEIADICECKAFVSFPIQAPYDISPVDLSTLASGWVVCSWWSNAANACIAPVPPPPQLVATISFDRNPIAPAGWLTANQQMNLTLTAGDPTGAPVPNATINMQFEGLGVVSGPGGPIGSNEIAATTDVNGQIALTYTAPSVLPPQGLSTLYAQAPNGNTIFTIYQFVPPQPAAVFEFSAVPIAPPSSLSVGQTVALTLQALQVSGKPFQSVNLHLSNENNVAAYGSAVVTDASGNTTALVSKDQAFTPDENGLLAIQYTSPPGPPLFAGMLDGIIATSGDEFEAITQYQISGPPAPLASLAFMPTIRIAPDASLAFNATAQVTLLSYDTNGMLITADVYLSFDNSQEPYGGDGIATVAGQQIPTVPFLFHTDSTGTLAITYTAPDPTWSTGRDIISAQDEPAGVQADVTASVYYSFSTSPPLLIYVVIKRLIRSVLRLLGSLSQQ